MIFFKNLIIRFKTKEKMTVLILSRYKKQSGEYVFAGTFNFEEVTRFVRARFFGHGRFAACKEGMFSLN